MEGFVSGKATRRSRVVASKPGGAAARMWGQLSYDTSMHRRTGSAASAAAGVACNDGSTHSAHSTLRENPLHMHTRRTHLSSLPAARPWRRAASAPSLHTGVGRGGADRARVRGWTQCVEARRCTPTCMLNAQAGCGGAEPGGRAGCARRQQARGSHAQPHPTPLCPATSGRGRQLQRRVRPAQASGPAHRWASPARAGPRRQSETRNPPGSPAAWAPPLPGRCCFRRRRPQIRGQPGLWRRPRRLPLRPASPAAAGRRAAAPRAAAGGRAGRGGRCSIQ